LSENLVLRQAQDEVFECTAYEMVLILSLSKDEDHAERFVQSVLNSPGDQPPARLEL